jgi:hypothetical protein
MARNYRKEYDRFQKHKSGYRARLNAINRAKGNYGNGDGLDESHQSDGSTTPKPSSKNKGKNEKSRKKGSKRRSFKLWDLLKRARNKK